MEGKIRLLVVNNTKDANPSWTIRNKIVADALNEMGHEIDCNTSASFMNLDDYDAVQFERFYEGSLKKEIETLKQLGKKIIYETDDNYNAVDQSHPFWKIRQHAQPSWKELMHAADAIIVSTTSIADEVMRMTGKEAYVIQNSLDFREYPERKGKNKKLRIGFQGSNIHSGDLLMVIDAIAELQREYEFEFYIFGIDDKPLPELYQFVTDYPEKYDWTEEFKKLYEKLRDMEYTHVPSTDYDSYRKKLANLNLDIGICPLKESSFNMSKSCLKFYEYAAVGTTALASKVIPYLLEMEDDDLAKNRFGKWKNRLRRLITDEEYRQKRGYLQQEWVHKFRNLDTMKFYWEKIYQKIIFNKQ
jgi:glycosyltransferase involved in cell wall biosynthesis